MENAVFNWNEFYSQENATTIEKLLDQKIAPLEEIIKIFFPNYIACNDIDSFLMQLTQSGVICDLISFMQPSTLLHCIQKNFYFLLAHRWLMWRQHCLVNIGEPHLQINVNNLLPLVIEAGALLEKTYQPPKLPGKHALSEYYNYILGYNTATTKEVISHSANYCVLESVMLTYFEAIKLITQSGCPESLLRSDAVKNGMCFLRVNPKHARTSKLKNTFNLDYLRNAHGGSAAYKTRYKGYERLKKETIEELFNGKTISVSAIPIENINIKDGHDAEIKARDNDGNPIFGTYIGRSLEVQTTDIETKLHQERRILACIQRMPDGTSRHSYEFRLKDTYFPQEYINALISWASQPAQAAKTADEEIYNSIMFSMQEIIDLRKDIPGETAEKRNQRITKLTDKYKNELDTELNKKFPRIHILQRVINLLRPIYKELNLELPLDKSCIVTDRRIRRENKARKK